MINKRPHLVVSTNSILSIEIHNMKTSKPYRPYDVKCDRSSPLGSPFYLKGDESKRDQVCDAYHGWFHTRVLLGKEPKAYAELIRLQALYKKHGQLRIFCWCAPKRCHTETIKVWLLENK